MGRAYEIRKADGTVIAASRLPELEVGDVMWLGGYDGPTEADYAVMIDPRDDPNWHDLAPTEPDAATPGYRVFIADADGAFQYAMNLTPEWVTWDAENFGMSYCTTAGCSVEPPAWFIKLIDKVAK